MVRPSRCSSAATTELSTPPDIATAIRSFIPRLQRARPPAKSAADGPRSPPLLQSNHPPAPPYSPAPEKILRSTALHRGSAPSPVTRATVPPRRSNTPNRSIPHSREDRAQSPWPRLRSPRTGYSTYWARDAPGRHSPPYQARVPEFPLPDDRAAPQV